MRATVWAVANELGVVAGTPGELLTALLSAPHRRTDRVVLPGDTPGIRELAADLRTLGHVEVALTDRAPAPELESPGNLSDPSSVCAADPVRVTRAYESGGDASGGDASGGDASGDLRTAWLHAGQALIRPDQTPPTRALTLLTALPENAAPHLRTALEDLSSPTPWEVVGTRPARARTLTTRDGEPASSENPRIKALAHLPDGTELHLDERGHLHTAGAAPVPRLVRAVASTLAAHPATALAATDDVVVTGDRMGSVHVFSLAGVRQAALHSGRVTALAAGPGPRVHSGGTDGTVRVWHSPHPPQDDPLVRRPHPVVALHAGPAGTAVAWADGLVELHDAATGEVRAFRPGTPVRAVAVPADGTLTVATTDRLIQLRPR
ncbi:hypothetical protein [Streptomyces sp. TRM49041]|uniref:WD40 repeat domain-containing protein n=1 Tax=Streptomyces sp. TRM49041 TaxID=2603216 RepID=UPI0011EF0ECC|nr:hypothetical protein [Streptomyces sp. TRM49041]